jgi:cytochrome c oxidase subunit IV
MATDTDQHADADVDHGHPSVGQYVEIGIILAVLTAIEVALYYAGQAGMPSVATIPAILFLTVMKFVLVVLWFMHLRFDHRLLRRVFVGGILLAAAVYGIVALIVFNQPVITQV